jgi:hypothetical protein
MFLDGGICGTSGKRYEEVKMTEYFVDTTSGVDTRNGLTIATAWKTMARVSEAVINPDDVININSGEVYPGRFAFRRSGVLGHPIVLRSYGDKAKPILDGSASNSMLISSPHSFLRFENIDFAGSTGSVNTVQLSSHDLEFHNCNFRDSKNKGGLGCWADQDTLYNISFYDCDFYDNYTNGAFTGGTPNMRNILFIRCWAHRNGHSLYADHGFYIGQGTTVDTCLADHNSGAGFKMNDNEVQPNYYPVVKNSETNNNHYGIVFTHKNAMANNNLIHSNTECNLLLYPNAWGGYRCFFNTVVNATHTSTRGVAFTAGSHSNCQVKNNLFIQDSAIVPKSNIEFNGNLSMFAPFFDYNLYYWNGLANGSIIYSLNGLATFAQWKAAGAELHGMLLNTLPDFVTRYIDFHPIPASNLVGKGIAISGYEMDKAGRTRTNPPTPGCYEPAYTQTSFSPSSSVSSSISPSVSKSASSSNSKSASSSMSKSASASESKSASASISKSLSPSNSVSPSLSPSSSISKSVSKSESTSISTSSSSSASISPSASVSPSPNAIVDLTQVVAELNESANKLEIELANIRNNIIEISQVIVLLEDMNELG